MKLKYKEAKTYEGLREKEKITVPAHEIWKAVHSNSVEIKSSNAFSTRSLKTNDILTPSAVLLSTSENAFFGVLKFEEVE